MRKQYLYGYDDDIERDLAEKGEEDADLISKEVANQKIIADLIIASPANRARQTAEIFARNLRYPADKIRSKRNYLRVNHPKTFF